jgi:hypothetical protein
MVQQADRRERRQQADHRGKADQTKIVRMHDAIVHG